MGLRFRVSRLGFRATALGLGSIKGLSLKGQIISFLASSSCKHVA